MIIHLTGYRHRIFCDIDNIFNLLGSLVVVVPIFNCMHF